jgi:hypothetical protein
LIDGKETEIDKNNLSDFVPPQVVNNVIQVATYLPKTVEIDGKETEIDKNNLSDLRLYVPPEVVNKVIEAILKAGYHNFTDRFFQYNIADYVDHIIKIDRDGTIESYFKYKHHIIKIDSDGTIESYFKYSDLTLPAIFETYSHYRHIYDKLHILYRGRLIDKIGSLYECKFLNVTDFPAPVITIYCKEPEQVYSMYMHYITKVQKK